MQQRPDEGDVGSRLRALRERKGLTARQVADLAGLTPAYLSRLENDRVSPTVTTLAKLLSAIGETMSTLFTDPLGPPTAVVRRADRHLMRSRGVLDSQVTPGWAKRLEVLESVVEPGGGSGRHPHTHAGEEECMLVLNGEFELVLGDDHLTLCSGDSATFACDVPHRWRNVSDVMPGTVLWIITPASY